MLEGVCLEASPTIQSVKLHPPRDAGSLGSSVLIAVSALTLILVHFQIFPFLSNCFLAVELENTQEVQSCSLFLKNQEDFPGLEQPTWGVGAVTPACHLPFLPGTGRTCQTGTSRS